MKRNPSATLGYWVQRFFEEYLPTLRGMSIHTIRSYRDALLLFLRFLAQQTRCRIEMLAVTDLNVARVENFLITLERERHNGIATRNARLAALHTFARFLASQHLEKLADFQAILSIPFKRGARQAPIEYFDGGELDALFKSIDRTSASGVRDYALFALMFNTGGRVQEILNLRVQDLRLEPPYQVRLYGKGNRTRLCPIWPATARCVQAHLDRGRLNAPESSAARVFCNRNGGALTRFGVRYLLKKHVTASITHAPTLRSKRLHPHSMRHSTGISLLKAGVDFATIAQWLGHASLNTTMRYARSDIDLKRAALAQVFPTALAPPKAGKLRVDGAELTNWLRRL
jgi:integrase/recombinase XerD